MRYSDSYSLGVLSGRFRDSGSSLLREVYVYYVAVCTLMPFHPVDIIRGMHCPSSHPTSKPLRPQIFTNFQRKSAAASFRGDAAAHWTLTYTSLRRHFSTKLGREDSNLRMQVPKTCGLNHLPTPQCLTRAWCTLYGTLLARLALALAPDL
jgi:hypothetical protein